MTCCLPLGLTSAAFAALSYREQALARFIDKVDMKCAIDRATRKRQVSERKMPGACLFLRQYLFQKAILGDGSEMVDQAADNVWHNWILHTREYREFQQECSRILDSEVWLDHGPYKDGAMTRRPGREVTAERFAALYGIDTSRKRHISG